MPWFSSSTEPKKMYSDDELNNRVSNDNYVVVRLLKYTFCIAMIIGIVLFAVGFFIQYLIDPVMHAKVNEVILQNMAGIALVALTIFGIKITKG